MRATSIPGARLEGSALFAAEAAAEANWDVRRSDAHTVQFYDDDDFFLDGLSRFIGAAVLAGDSAIVIATKSHRVGLERRLTSRGLSLNSAIAGGRYLSLDAAETLSKFMVDGRPDGARFSSVVGALLRQLKAAAQPEFPRIAAFGEMVALLWAEGKKQAAIQLEQLWNELAQTHSFHLHCAYPIRLFAQEKDADLLKVVCSAHSLALPSEGYTALPSEEERQRAVIFLQQKAQALESEILQRKQADQSRRESEERLRIAQQVAGIGSFEWNANTNLSRWTPELEAMHGLPPGGYAGTQEAWEKLLHPDDRSEALKLVAEGYETGAPVQGEWRVIWPDGSIHWIAAKWQVFKDESGNPERISGANIDITDRKRAEEASHHLAAIVQCADDAIISKDLNGIVTSWNRAAENIFGYKAEEIVGRSILLIVPPEFHDQEPRILEKIGAGERIEHFETVRLRKDGERLNVSLTISPVTNPKGKIIGVAKIVRNITEQKKLEKDLRTSEKLAAVGRLAATIAHEINNPLEAVTNFIYLARQEPELRDQLKDYLRSADRELKRVAHIARQTLGFYRDNCRPLEFGVAKAVDDVLTVYESRCKYKALRVEKRIQRGLKVCTVQGEFKQILSNLMANAIDASREGGKILLRVRATRYLRSGQKGICVTVADNGVGISPENSRKLFTPFFTTKREVGTGLGLWITKDLIEKRGGRICFRSHTETKPGTIMTFFLPIEPAPPSLKASHSNGL